MAARQQYAYIAEEALDLYFDADSDDEKEDFTQPSDEDDMPDRRGQIVVVQ